MWQYRIGEAQRDADVWQELLSVRYLAVPPSHDTRTWLKFCSLLRKASRSSLSRKLLVQLLGVDPHLNPQVELRRCAFRADPITAAPCAVAPAPADPAVL